MSVLSVLKKKSKATQQPTVSPELGVIVSSSLHSLVQHVLSESTKLTPTPTNAEIAEALRVSVGEEAVTIWEDLIDELGF